MTEPRTPNEDTPPPSVAARPRRRRLALLLTGILLAALAAALTHSGSHPSLMARARRLPVPADSETTTVLWTGDYTALVVTHPPVGIRPLTATRAATTIDARTGARSPARPFYPLVGKDPAVWFPATGYAVPPTVSPDGRCAVCVCSSPGLVHAHVLSTDGRWRTTFRLGGIPQHVLWRSDSRRWLECSTLADGMGLYVFSHDLAAPGADPRKEATIPDGEVIGLTQGGDLVHRPGGTTVIGSTSEGNVVCRPGPRTGFSSDVPLRYYPLGPSHASEHRSVARLPFRAALHRSAFSPAGDRIAWLIYSDPRPWYGCSGVDLLSRLGIGGRMRCRMALCVSRADGSDMREVGSDVDAWEGPLVLAWLSDGRHVRIGAKSGWYVVPVE